MSNRIQPCRLDLTRCSGLAIFRSSDWSLSFKISERDNLTDTPIDLTGYTGKASIKYSLTDENPIAEPTVETYADGTVVVGLGSSLTKNILVPGKTFNDPCTLQYEIILHNTETDEDFRTLYGEVEVIGSCFDGND